MSKIIFIWMMVTRVITPMGEKNDGREMYTICVENNQGVVVCYDHAYKEEILEYRDMVLNRIEDYTHLVYIPIQYPVIDDGFRFANEKFRHKIDYELKNFLYEHKIRYYTISGQPQMRLNQIISILEE